MVPGDAFFRFWFYLTEQTVSENREKQCGQAEPAGTMCGNFRRNEEKYAVSVVSGAYDESKASDAGRYKTN